MNEYMMRPGDVHILQSDTGTLEVEIFEIRSDLSSYGIVLSGRYYGHYVPVRPGACSYKTLKERRGWQPDHEKYRRLFLKDNPDIPPVPPPPPPAPQPPSFSIMGQEIKSTKKMEPVDWVLLLAIGAVILIVLASALGFRI